MVENKRRLNVLVIELTKEEIKRIDINTKKGKRVPIHRLQEQEVIDKYDKKCWICGRKYDKPRQFKFHHKDGNPANTQVPNFILLCSGCHDEVHGQSEVQVKEYKIKMKNKVITNPKKKPEQSKKTDDFGVRSPFSNLKPKTIFDPNYFIRDKP
jgi:5-methylcytosine-specific restriction endonuclease McrA